jgi:hypothetical protein
MRMRLTVAAARRSWGQAEFWSAGSKHQVTALKDSSRRSDWWTGSGPPRINDVGGRPHHRILPPQPPAPRDNPHKHAIARHAAAGEPQPPQTRARQENFTPHGVLRAPETGG